MQTSHSYLLCYCFILFLCVCNTSFGQYAQSLSMPGQVLVTYKPSVNRTNSTQKRQNLGIEKIAEIPKLNVELWKVPSQHTVNGKSISGVNNWVQHLRETDADIVNVQPNYIYGSSTTTPNDPSFANQWGLQNNAFNGCPTGVDIGALTAWDVRNDAKYAKVGVLDTGIEWTHPDLKDNIWQNLAEDADGDSTVLVWNGSTWIFDPGDQNGIDDDLNGYIDDFIGWDFVNSDNNPLDDNGHGTHVSGIIGAKSDNGIGISGVVGAGVQMMAIKVMDESGTGTSFSILSGLQYSVINEAMITNNSYGGGADDAAISSYITNQCTEAGQLFIAAAGNNGLDNDVYPFYPADYESDIIVVVGAHTCTGGRPAFSNYGSTAVDIFAPGDAIYSCDLGGTYSYRSGTSMAAPFITAAAVLAWKQFSYSTPAMIKNRLLNAATADSLLNNKCVANGRLDLIKTLTNIDYQLTGVSDWKVYEASGTVNNVTADGDNIWVARRVGAEKYNRITGELTHYNVYNSNLGSNVVNGIAVDAQGNKWFATKMGIYKFDDLNWTDYYSSFLSYIEMNDVKIDPSGNVWAISNDGLFKYDGNIWTTYNQGNSGLISDLVYAIDIDSVGNIWLGTQNGVSKFNGTTWTNYTTTSGLVSNFIRRVKVDTVSNSVWFGTNAGVSNFDGTTWTSYTSGDSGLNDDEIYTIVVDLAGNVYFGSEGNALSKFDGTNWMVYDSTNSGLPYSMMIASTIDADANIWLATVDEGLYKFDGTDWNYINITNSELPLVNGAVRAINAIAIESTGEKWLGTKDGVFMLLNDNWQTYTTANSSLLHNEITDIKIDAAGNKWIATLAGLNKFDGSTWTSYDTANSDLSNINLSCLAIDAAGNIWIGTFGGGLCRFDGTNWTIYDTGNSGITNNDITDIAIDNAGNKWIATGGGGFWKFDGTTWADYAINMTFPAFDGYISTVAIDGAKIWGGTTDRGAYLLVGSTWTLYDHQNSGLADNNVVNIAIDSYGNVWFTTFNGVSKFNGTTWTTYYEHFNIGNTDRTNTAGIAFDSEGNIWIGSECLSELNSTTTSFGTTKFLLCEGESLTFTNNSTDLDSTKWYVNSTEVATTTDLTYTFATSGVQKVEMVIYKGNVQKSFFQYIIVREPITISLGKDTSICHSVYYFNTYVGAKYYRWKNLAGTVLDSLDYYTISGLATHTVILEVEDECGSIDRDTVAITLTGGCVLPGDTNEDGTVDMEDYLALAYTNGRTGTVRPSATSFLTYQSCPDWSTSWNGVNDKHADCNGDGLVQIGGTSTLADDSVVLKNATSAIRTRKGTTESIYNLRLIRQTPAVINLGDTIKHAIDLTRYDNNTIPNMKEIGFSTKYNLNMKARPFLNLNNSWLGGTRYGGVIQKGKKADFGIMGSTTGSGSGAVGTGGTTPKNKDIDTTHQTHSIFLTLTTYNGVLADASGNDTLVQTVNSHNTETVEIVLPWNQLNIHVFLQGPYDSTNQTMLTDLQTLGVLPRLNPYSDYFPPYAEQDIPTDAVDWVEVQLRKSLDSTSEGIIEQRAAWLMKDGHLQDARNGGNLYLLATEGDYYLVIKHRNHLAIMSASPIHLSADQDIVVDYDFTSDPTQAFGTDAQAYIGNGKYGMYAGDCSGDGTLTYLGAECDADAILSRIDNPNDATQITTSGYYYEDTNLDGKVQYSGLGNDRAVILLNVGGDNPNNTRTTNVPE